ncbi:LuxR C-terminal-related transcriptional regulator [Streptomyces sp. NPDC086549]|uniref:helix-turn-helix transcriptional regulator n=1 Tax=Streptomyces sp. NPDC086549 TaxID=3365752 RepID=UPI0037F7159B
MQSRDGWDVPAWAGEGGSEHRLCRCGESEAGPNLSASGLNPSTALGQEAAMRRLIERTTTALRDMAEEFDELGDSLGRNPARPENGWQHRVAAYAVEFLTDPAEIAEALLDAAAVAVNEIMSMHPGPVVTGAALAEELERTRYARARGVTVRSIYAESFSKSPNGAKHLRNLAALGVQIRLLGSVPFRVVVSDTLAMFSASGDDGLTVLRPALMAGIGRQVLEHWWAVATPLDELAHDLEDGPTPQEQAILRLMSAGVRDTSIAREIGVSIRTFRRNLVTLMNKLGAENRFQAGVKACSKGWL